jgi:fluoride ion exporter CrcB/FEX
MQNYLWVMLGSALGGGARYWISGLIADQIGDAFPWGTLLVNVSGSFIIGFFATLTGTDGRISSRVNDPSIRHDRYLRRVHDLFIV